MGVPLRCATRSTTHGRFARCANASKCMRSGDHETSFARDRGCRSNRFAMRDRVFAVVVRDHCGASVGDAAQGPDRVREGAADRFGGRSATMAFIPGWVVRKGIPSRAIASAMRLRAARAGMFSRCARIGKKIEKPALLQRLTPFSHYTTMRCKNVYTSKRPSPWTLDRPVEMAPGGVSGVLRRGEGTACLASEIC